MKLHDRAYTPDLEWIASVNPDGGGDWVAWGPKPVTDDTSKKMYPDGGGFKCPYGRPGDRLWVRETFVIEEGERKPTDGRPYQIMTEEEEEWAMFGPYRIPHYRATEPEPHIVPPDLEDGLDDRTRWHPSIFMPKWTSRITLVVLNVRVERLNDISNEDVIAEGVDRARLGETVLLLGMNAVTTLDKYRFAELWDKFNKFNKKKGYGWNENPWVWVVEFAAISPGLVEDKQDGRDKHLRNDRAGPVPGL